MGTSELTPVFDLVCLGGSIVNSEKWIDITSYGPDTNSPIPSGQQLYLGYATFISPDKACTFQLRPNLATKSLGTDADTQLRAFSSVPKEDSKDVDLTYYGNIATLAPVSAASTGVEKLWLKVTSGSNTAGDFEFVLYYTLY